MFSSTNEIGRTKSQSSVLIILASMPTMTVSAVFSKSVSWMSIERNSTLQPMSVSAVGGFLNLREFQFVDYRFSKWELPSIGGHLVHHLVHTPSLISHLASHSEQHDVIDNWSLKSVYVF